MHLEFEEGRVRQSGQTELVDRNYEEHCASIRSDRRTDQLDENMQVDVTIMVVTNNIEFRSFTAQSVLALNVMDRVENNETTVKNKRVAPFLLSQLAQHQKAQEITQTEVELHGCGAGEVELGVPMADKAPLLAHTDCLKAS